jgi:hypothetical protein
MSPGYEDLKDDDPILAPKGNRVLGALGDIGKAYAKRLAPPILQDAYSQYRNRQRGAQNLPGPMGPQPVNPDGTPAPELQGMPDASLGPQENPQMATQWNDGGWNAQPEPMARGKLVTTPTLARIAESGPEMVIPLTPRMGNHVQSDMLGGLRQPGLARYQRISKHAY